MKRCRKHQHGVALVTTVIVVAVLAVVAVAFMQSTTVDRQSSRSVANYTRAKLAAEAGAASAQGLVADLVRRYPDSVTVWQNIGGGSAAGTNNEATVLYVRAQSANTNLGARPAQFGGEVTLLARPLVSLASGGLFPLSGISSALPTNSPQVVNLNATNASRPRPLVGLRFATDAPVTAAQWVYLTNSAGETNARFAYWIEDESFKVNVNVVTNGPRGVESLGLSPAEVRLDGSWGSSSNNALSSSGAASAVISARSALPGRSFPTALTAAIPANFPANNTNAADGLKFLTTTFSAGLDLSRGGFKRFNINAVTNGVGGATDANNIRTGLNRVIAAITNTNSAPNFGQRFYRLATSTTGVNAVGAVTTAHAPIYLQKVAANLLDSVDANDQPTVINNDGSFTLRTGRPEWGIEAAGGGTDGANSVAAMGVENVPRLQEYAIHGRLRRMDPIGFNSNSPPADPVAQYQVSIDHYFEFWNPGTRDITLTNAFLKIYDQPRFGNNATGPLAAEGRPTSEIPVNNVVFPAGQVTVLTTAPQAEINTLLVGANASRVVSLPTPDADRLFSGETRDVSTNSFGGFNRLFNLSMKPRQSTLLDFESAVLLGNASGILESFTGLSISVSSDTPPPSPMHFVVSNADVQASMADLGTGNAYFVRGGSLVGNDHITSVSTPSSTEGDPRALNEQLEFRLYASGSVTGAREQTRFFLTISNNGTASVPGPNSSVGTANANYVRPVNWVDHSSIASGASNAPLVVRNGAIQSIGELGHVTDPARVPGTAGTLTNIIYSRGGGRTLRLGQPEHPRWYDGNQTNASRTWTSWRLADLFTTTTASNNATSPDAQGNLTNSLGVVRGTTNTNGAVLTIPGLINPNGVLRDGGAALRAALNGMTMLPSPDGSVNTAGRPVNVGNVVNSLLARMTNITGSGLPTGAANVLWERGEVSELPLFNSGTQLAVNMQQAFDRGREEVVRRSIEMLTTRGSIFTLYAIGQTLQGTNVTSIARMKQTFQIEPQYATTDAFNDNFNPSQAVRVTRRFSAPTNYSIRVLSTAFD